MGYLKIILATLLLQVVSAQQPQAGSIEGRVTNTSGDVLSKVTVTLLGSASPSPSTLTATTDANGKFTFENLKPGTYRLRAARQGFVGRDYGQKGPNGTGVPVPVSPGQKLRDMTIALTPQGAITGRIVDRNGMPEIRALVQAWMPVYMGPLQGRPLTAIQSTTTDDQGNYRLFWLPPGAYFITASPDGAYGLVISTTSAQNVVSTSFTGLNNAVHMNGQARSDGTRDEVSEITTYYPGVVNLKEVTSVVVRAGATAAGVDIAIASVPVHRIRGVTINGNTGSPESMRVQLSSTSDSNIGSISHNSSDTGAFEFGGLLPGLYYLMAQGDAFTFAAPINVGNEDLNNIVVNARLQFFSILGRITVDGTPSNGAEPIPGLRIRLTPVIPPGILPAPQVELRGREFTMRSVFPGDYRVAIEGNPNLYLKSVRLGNQDGMDILHIPSQPESPMELELSSHKGGIDGRIVNERREPAFNATVVLVPDSPLRQRAALYVTPTVDASGKFHIDAVPGFYKVFAWEDLELGIWMDPDFMLANETRGRPIVVSEGRNEAIEVPVIPYVP
ncbi:MAG TPA: carboxypeptidase-like regulatory domain-containing protein [Terriglobia bacterium]|nr:carboxypeptidase-like regulatory domain-containing protein [Terriglobia bacterium]